MSRDFARTLRKNMTDAERAAWKGLRGRQLAGFRFRRQVPVGPYIADFACFEAKLVLELDGGQHGEDDGRRRDGVAGGTGVPRRPVLEP